MKKIAIIGSAGIPAKYGGFETLTENLVKNLSPKYKFIVFCSKKVVSKIELTPFANVKYILLPFPANGLFSIIYDSISLFISLFRADIILILGCSAGIAIPFFRIFKKLIFHFDGVEWKRQRWYLPVKLYLHLSSWIASVAAHYIIADNEKIIHYIPTNNIKKISVITYGGDHVSPMPDKQIDSERFMIISRAVPENNLETILNTFADKPRRYLLIVSNYNHTRFGGNMYKKYHPYPNIEFSKAVYNKNELTTLRRSGRIYIHGHSSGGTNPSLVEAMWSGMPVICHDNIFNRQTTRDQAFYFKDAGSLSSLIESLSTEELKANTEKMLNIAREHYTWKRVCSEYSQLFMSF